MGIFSAYHDNFIGQWFWQQVIAITLSVSRSLLSHWHLSLRNVQHTAIYLLSSCYKQKHIVGKLQNPVFETLIFFYSLTISFLLFWFSLFLR